MFVNRMKSNSSRGRTILTDSSVQTQFINMTTSHSRLLAYIKEMDDKRMWFEQLQDKLTQVKDSRAALDVLRQEHQEKLRRQAEEQERQRQMQMAYKLEVMRKKKQEYLQYQRQLALQRIQEQEREMQIRQEQQKAYHMSGATQLNPYMAAMMPPPPQQSGPPQPQQQQQQQGSPIHQIVTGGGGGIGAVGYPNYGGYNQMPQQQPQSGPMQGQPRFGSGGGMQLGPSPQHQHAQQSGVYNPNTIGMVPPNQGMIAGSQQQQQQQPTHSNNPMTMQQQLPQFIPGQGAPMQQQNMQLPKISGNDTVGVPPPGSVVSSPPINVGLQGGIPNQMQQFNQMSNQQQPQTQVIPHHMQLPPNQQISQMPAQQQQIAANLQQPQQSAVAPVSQAQIPPPVTAAAPEPPNEPENEVSTAELISFD